MIVQRSSVPSQLCSDPKEPHIEIHRIAGRAFTCPVQNFTFVACQCCQHLLVIHPVLHHTFALWLRITSTTCSTDGSLRHTAHTTHKVAQPPQAPGHHPGKDDLLMHTSSTAHRTAQQPRCRVIPWRVGQACAGPVIDDCSGNNNRNRCLPILYTSTCSNLLGLPLSAYVLTCMLSLLHNPYTWSHVNLTRVQLCGMSACCRYRTTSQELKTSIQHMQQNVVDVYFVRFNGCVSIVTSFFSNLAGSGRQDTNRLHGRLPSGCHDVTNFTKSVFIEYCVFCQWIRGVQHGCGNNDMASASRMHGFEHSELDSIKRCTGLGWNIASRTTHNTTIIGTQRSNVQAAASRKAYSSKKHRDYNSGLNNAAGVCHASHMCHKCNHISKTGTNEVKTKIWCIDNSAGQGTHGGDRPKRRGSAGPSLKGNFIPVLDSDCSADSMDNNDDAKNCCIQYIAAQGVTQACAVFSILLHSVYCCIQYIAVFSRLLHSVDCCIQYIAAYIAVFSTLLHSVYCCLQYFAAFSLLLYSVYCCIQYFAALSILLHSVYCCIQYFAAFRLLLHSV